jgi:uncharacterized membrane protein YeaQ/YmgE (transglycosylase-associated protein family)
MSKPRHALVSVADARVCVPGMSVIAYILALALSGLLVGALARLALPGRDPMSLIQTMLVGIAGSFLAGLVYALIFRRNGGGIILAVLFATVIVYFIRRSRGGSLTRPAGDGHLDGGRRNAGVFGGSRRR